MSILTQLRAKQKAKGVFGIVAGTRLAGKSSLAGTLPGNTLLMQAAVKETGSESAKKLAEKLGNKLEVIGFGSVKDIMAVIKEFPGLGFDNLYVDGISAITEMRHEEKEVQAMLESPKGPWGAFDAIKQTMHTFIEESKRVSEEHGKNVFLTLALDPVLNEAGQVVELKPALKGKATLAEIKKYGNSVLVVTARLDEQGQTVRELITKTRGPYSARIDTLLDSENPGIMPADLSKVLKLIKGETK